MENIKDIISKNDNTIANNSWLNEMTRKNEILEMIKQQMPKIAPKMIAYLRMFKSLVLMLLFLNIA